MKYNAISKFETSASDLIHMKDWLEVNDLGELQERQQNTDESSSKFLIDLESKFSVIPEGVLAKLCDVYYWDFTLFGYELPSFC